MYFTVDGYECYVNYNVTPTYDVILKDCYDYMVAVSIGQQLQGVLKGTGVTIKKVEQYNIYGVTIHGVTREELLKWQD